MKRLTDPTEAAHEIVRATGGDIRLALPLGLGKPVTLVNALVRLACRDPSINLEIFTALTLEVPATGNEMQQRFLDPAKERLFGAYPPLLYAEMLRKETLPDNIRVSEFFLMAGNWLGSETAQQNYLSANYTHALDVLVSRRPNVLIQLVAQEGDAFSLSCNTDISSDLFRLRDDGALDFFAVAETNPQLPFLGAEEAVLSQDAFDLVLDPEDPFELFSAVKRPVGLSSHAIGLHVARLIEDGGTLQIGIGAIGDAVAHALLLRHRSKVEAIQRECPFDIAAGAKDPFDTGLHAVTEMLVGGLLALFEEGVVSREVNGHAIYAGFFVETRDFYRKLREMPSQTRDKIAMVPVSFTNSLYGDEAAKRAARVKARFVNGAMKVSLLGDVMSDSVADGQVVSGVGGQFNFVDQAFALDDGRSIITLPATRQSGGMLESNIVWTLDATTVPRHMRDIVVTEYGVADIYGKSDAEVIAALIEIADSRFQADLMDKAKTAGKLPSDYRIPTTARQNLPDTLSNWLANHRDLLPDYPFGTDFTEIEQALIPALETLKEQSATFSGYLSLARAAVLSEPHPKEQAAMQRMGFDPTSKSLLGLALRGALRLTAARA
jgi:hypothetical protein